MGKGICGTNTGAEFQRELYKHFASSSVEKEARARLRRLKQTGSVATISTTSLPLLFKFSTGPIRILSSTSKMVSRIGLRQNLIGVAYKLSMTPSPLWNHLLITSLNPRRRGLAMVKVGERAGRTRATT